MFTCESLKLRTIRILIMYTVITKFWKSHLLTNDINWLAKPLTWLITNYWSRAYELLEHIAIPYNKNRVIEFTFDLGKLGDLTPWLLGCIFYTILQHPLVQGRVDNAQIILSAFYEGDVKSLAKHYNLTRSSTPEDFMKHFLHLANKHGHGESKVVLANAQFLKAKVILTTSINSKYYAW